MPSFYDEPSMAFNEAIRRLGETLEAQRRAQSERVGPSPFSGPRDFLGEEPPTRQLLQDLADRLRAQQFANEVNIWRDGAPPEVRDTATAVMARARQVGTYQWYHIDNYGRRMPGQTQPRQPESAPQARGGQMRISSKPDPLSVDEKRAAKVFLKEAFEKGFARYPFGNNRLVIYKDGCAVWIYTDGRWSSNTEYIYVGCREDVGTGGMESPGNRLAVMVALMGACDLQTDAELLSLFEKRLAGILAGVYSNAIAPLAVRSNDEPIARMAWSAEGGVAAFIDGEWVTPITGEKVQVGEGWSVVETGEGRPQPSQSAPLPAQAGDWNNERFQQLARTRGWTTISRLPDGRDWEYWSSNQSELEDEVRAAADDGNPGLVVEQDPRGRWGITYPLAVPVVAQSRAEEFARIVARFGTSTTPDGRLIVTAGANSREDIENNWLTVEPFRPHTWMIADQYVNSYNGNTVWGVTYPREDLAVVQSSQQAEGRQLLRGDFDRWVEASGGWTITQTNDGRPIVAFGSSEQYVRDQYLTRALREGGPNVEMAQNTRGSWGIAPVWAPLPESLSVRPNVAERFNAAIRGAGRVGTPRSWSGGRLAWTVGGIQADAVERLAQFQAAGDLPEAYVTQENGMWAVVVDTVPVSVPGAPVAVPTLGEANRQLRMAIDTAGNRGMGPILVDGRQSWACIDEASAQAYLSRYQAAAPIPHAVIENLGRDGWYVVSMPASQLSDPF